MKILRLTALAAVLIFGVAFGDDEVERKMEFKFVVADDESGDVSTLDWSSDSMDFDLQDLAMGETRVIEGDSGETATVTRGENGFTFDVDGQSVVLPDMGEHGSHIAIASSNGMDHDVDVEIFGNAHAIRAHPAEGVTIISSKPLDSSVRESIKSVLVSAGSDDEVTFIDGSETGKRVMMVKKKIEIVK